MKGLFLLLALISTSVFAKKITDYTPFEYDLRFTNPLCDAKAYSVDDIVDHQGNKLTHTKKNVYCNSGDAQINRERENSPFNKLIQWIKDPSTKEIFLSYLSYSESRIFEALKEAMIQRQVKVTLVLDSNADKTEDGRYKAQNIVNLFEEIEKECGGENLFRYEFRGNIGGLGYAHNKIFIVNPLSSKEVRENPALSATTKIAFSSANMSTGVTTHHENWNFLTTNVRTYFAQAHFCVMEATLDHANKKSEFAKYMAECRDKIKDPLEEDIQAYFVPGKIHTGWGETITDGDLAMARITRAFRKSNSVKMAAHRFIHGDLIHETIPKFLAKGGELDLVVDDDIYWIGQYNVSVGRNMFFEYNNVNKLNKLGMHTRYMETAMSIAKVNDKGEPLDEETFAAGGQLHHNKYLIFNYYGGGGAVFTGAGNFTKAAFTKNFENFYFIEIPEVVEKFKKQYNYVWHRLSTEAEDMPTKLVRAK